MLIAGLLRWWYVDGWLGQLSKTRWALLRMADHFSIGLLLRTLFAPFRQISADETARGASGVMNVIVDKLISRLIGGFMRTVMVIVGSIGLVLLTLVSLVRLVGWALLPFMPLLGLAAMTIVGAPWKIL